MNKFWEDSNRVASFAAKAADHRLVELVKHYRQPGKVKVLDLGCAAGRNTVFMAECGFDIWAVDSSLSMITRTKKSLAPHLNPHEIEEKIIVGQMNDLSWAQDNYFDLIIALGIYHNAQSDIEFKQALSESSRVLKPSGKLLVATFAPGTLLPHLKLEKVSDHIEKDKDHGNMYFLTSTELDEMMINYNFIPVTTTATVEKEIENGKRITVNALYTKK